MTTPDTAAVRTWARENGYDVADRGRLRPEVLEAYNAAQGKGAPARKAPAKKKAAAAKKAPAAKKTVAAKTAPAVKATTTKAPAPEPQPEPKAPAAAKAGEPKPRPVTDDRRLVALGEEIAALTERVAQLEKQLNGKSGKSTSKTPRFRRSK